jgi:hypothetical protein
MRTLSPEAQRESLLAEFAARTETTDFRPGGIAAQEVESFASRFDGLSDLLVQVRNAGLIGGATGADLDALMADVLPSGLERAVGRRATGGAFAFTRPTSADMPALEVPAGWAVLRQDNVRYLTLSAATLGMDQTTSSTVQLVCLQSGTVGNCGAGAINKLGAPYAGVTGGSNASAITNGPDGEEDEAARSRLRRWVASSTRAVPAAILNAALNAVDEATGAQVQFAQLGVPDEARPGVIELWIDDGTGDCGVEEEQAEETLLQSAGGGESRFYLANRPVKTPPEHVWVEGNPVVFTIVRPLGLITLGVEVETGDEVVSDTYTSWGGLVRAVQVAVDGDPADPVGKPGQVAAGCVCYVRPASRMTTGGAGNLLPIEAAVALSVAGPLVTSVLAELKQSIVAMVNALDIGQSLYPAMVIDVLMQSEYVKNVEAVWLDGALNQTKYCGTGRVIRTSDALIDLH